MARCETCGRKLKNPVARFCGGDKCVAKPAEIVPRCTKCGQLLHDGVLSIPCPADGQSHTVVSGGNIVTAGNASVTIPTVAAFNKGV